ncbi:MAG: glucose-1-phosphate adenylyltransferase subunit GlgD [Clostridia bacterium]
MMQNNVFGLIYTGESNMQLRDITVSRSIAAVPFGGRYRCIDFVMSALVNSGITNVGLIMQKNYHSLIDHVGSGKEWDLHRKRDGLFILPPFLTKDNIGIFKGTVDALQSSLGYIRRSSQRYMILTGSHTLYNMQFNDMIAQHMDTGADITMMYNIEKRFNSDDQYDDLRLTMDDSGRITDMMIDPFKPVTNCRCCDVYIMEKTLLEYLIEEATTHALHDFTKDILLKKVNSLKMYGYRYDGYVARLDSLNLFYKHNMALLDREVREDLFNPDHPIYTKIKDEVPAKYGSNAHVRNSIVADGCVIDGIVENSVLFRGVRIEAGAEVRNCIVMQGSEIQRGASLDCTILDKSVTVKRNRRLAGYDGFPVILRKGSIV